MIQANNMKLPASVQDIADVIGDERALYLIGRLPRCIAGNDGKRSERVIMYVPQRLTFDHVLVRILGWQDAQKLVDVFGGEILCPANCTGIYREFRDQHIVRLLAKGMTTAMVAEWFGITAEQVRRIRREKPQEERRAANDNNTDFETTPRRRANEQHETAAA